MDKAMKKFIDIIDSIGAALIGATVIIIFLQILWRYVFRNPLIWSEQLCRYIFIWICMLGVPVAVFRGSTFAFDLIVNRLPKKVQKVISILLDLLNTFFCGFWAYWSYVLTVKAGWKNTQGFVIKYGYLYSAQIVCGALLVIVLIYHMISTIKSFNEPEPEKGAQA